MGNIVPDVSQSSPSSVSPSSVVQGSILPKFLDQWRSITCSRFVLDRVKGYYLRLRCCPSLFHSFWWFNIKTTLLIIPLPKRR